MSTVSIMNCSSPRIHSAWVMTMRGVLTTTPYPSCRNPRAISPSPRTLEGSEGSGQGYFSISSFEVARWSGDSVLHHEMGLGLLMLLVNDSPFVHDPPLGGGLKLEAGGGLAATIFTSTPNRWMRSHRQGKR